MTPSPQTPGVPRPRGPARFLLAALFAAALLVPPARAAAPAPLALAGASGAFWAPAQWALGTQRRMLQVGTVGMCVALYIIMWRK